MQLDQYILSNGTLHQDLIQSYISIYYNKYPLITVAADQIAGIAIEGENK